MRILTQEVKELCNRVIPYVKVLFGSHEEREVTWEPEVEMLESCPYPFEGAS